MEEYREVTAWVRCEKCGSLRTPDMVYIRCPFNLRQWFDPNLWDKWAARYEDKHGSYPVPEWGQEWLACSCPRCGYSWEMRTRASRNAPGPQGAGAVVSAQDSTQGDSSGD